MRAELSGVYLLSSELQRTAPPLLIWPLYDWQDDNRHFYSYYEQGLLRFFAFPGAIASSNNAEAGMRCLVVGAPRVGGLRWASVHAQLKEAELVADMLRVTPLTDYQVTIEMQ